MNLPFLHVLLTRLRALRQRDAVRDEISEELQFHLEQRTADLKRRGIPPADAARQARRRFGNVASLADRAYDIRGGGFMETVGHDVRYAIRLLRRQPVFAAVAIVTFALGIGATAALYSVMDAALLRPLPFPEPDQLVSVAVRIETPTGTKPGPGASLRDARQWRSLPALAGVALWTPAGGFIADSGEPERLVGQRVSEGYFEMFGVAPIIGRTFTEDMTRQEAPAVAVLGHAYWRRRFNADPLIVGRSIRVGRESITIVGVLPEGFERSTDIWLPIKFDASLRGFTAAYARLRDGIALEAAQREWTGALSQGPAWPAGASIELAPLADDVSRASRKTVTSLAWGVGLILLIACVNMAGLLLARGSSRGPELAVRASMGAGRGRLVRQLLTESAVVASGGMVAGLALAWLTLDIIVGLVPLELPDSVTPSLNWLVIALTSTTAIATALLFGAAPARRLSRDAATSLASGGNSRGHAPLTRRTGQALIAIELGLAVVLVTGAGLVLKSLDRLLSADLGFNPDSVMVLRAAPLEPTPESLQVYYAGLVEKVQQMPGVIAAGVTDCVPLKPCGTSMNAAGPEGAPRMVDVQFVSPGYFRAVEISLRAGRLFAPERTGSRDADHVILDDLAASQFFPDSNPIGRTVTLGKAVFQVVGVVGHVRRRGALNAAERASVYRLVPPKHAGALDVVLRTASGSGPTEEHLRQAALSSGTRVLVDRIGTGAGLLADNLATPSRRTTLLGLLAALGLILTLVGISSVTAYAVARRTREIGVRMAFGAAPSSVVWTLMRDVAWPVVIGIAAGLAASQYATRIIASFLFETTPTDPSTFAAAAALLVVTSLTAAWLPARRAAGIDPVRALRSE